jgi:hypothetical protein
MTLYYYNHSQGHERIATFFNGISDSKCITNEDCRRRPQFNEGDVVFVHPGDDETTGYGKQWWVDLARNNITVDFVFMSTQPTEIGPGEADSADIHYCRYAADTLSEQPRVKEFFTLLIAKGGKHWDLLIPPPFPEYLVAAYLAQTAAIKGVSVNPESGCTGFWKKAREEFGQYSAQEREEPDFMATGNPSKLRSLLESIAGGS